MRENIIIIEDSSKFHFGGGQKITLAVATLLQRTYRLFLLDCSEQTLFQKKMRPLVKDVLFLRCHGRFKQGKRASFNVSGTELILAVPLLLLNAVRILTFLRSRSLSQNNTIQYAATKKALLTAFLIKKLRGIEYLYHAHTVDDRRSFLYLFLDVLLRNARAVICVSRTVKDNISLPNCSLIYNPVPHAPHYRPKNMEARDRIVVASFATLIPLKGIEYFMQSHRFLKNRERVVFWIFGEGPAKEQLRRYESAQVVLKGFTEEVAGILRDHVSIVVAPSVIPESFGMIIGEALACGIPVITTNIGAQAELVRDGYAGYQVPVRDPQAIAEKIDLLIDNPRLYQGMSQNALEHVRSYDVSVFNRSMLDLLEQVSR